MRLAQCNAIWKRLETFWKHSNTPKRTKLHVYDAVIRAKILYGLDIASLTNKLLKKLDTFQLKGLRQILKIDTTWAQKKQGKEMSNKSNEVYERAARILHPREDRYMFYNNTHSRWQFAETHWSDKFKPISQVYDEYRREHIASIIRASSNVITTQLTNPLTAL